MSDTNPVCDAFPFETGDSVSDGEFHDLLKQRVVESVSD